MTTNPSPAVPTEPSIDPVLAYSLAERALRRMAAANGPGGAIFEVTPYLNIDRPESIRGFDCFKTALLDAYREGQAGRTAGEFLLESSAAGDWTRLIQIGADGQRQLVSEGHSIGVAMFQDALTRLGISLKRVELPASAFE